MLKPDVPWGGGDSSDSLCQDARLQLQGVLCAREVRLHQETLLGWVSSIPVRNRSPSVAVLASSELFCGV